MQPHLELAFQTIDVRMKSGILQIRFLATSTTTVGGHITYDSLMELVVDCDEKLQWTLDISFKWS